MNWDSASLSREIAAAMFRVAAVTKNDKIRDIIESSAILLVSSQDQPSIKKSEEIIRFAEAVGEIKSVNVRVLVRELNNLKKLIQEDEQSANVDISTLFIRQVPEGDYVSESSDTREGNKQARQPAGAPNVDSANVAKTAGRASIYNGGQKLSESANNQGRRSSFNPDKIFSYINERGQARLKELESVFPEVSGRTLRRATDLLIKDGSIERVGNPGPSSYYRPLVRRSVERVGDQGVPDRHSSESSVTPAEAGALSADVVSTEADSLPSVTPTNLPAVEAGAGTQSPEPTFEPSQNIPAQIGTWERITPSPSFMRAIPVESSE